MCAIFRQMTFSLLRVLYNVAVFKGTGRHSRTPGCSVCDSGNIHQVRT